MKNLLTCVINRRIYMCIWPAPAMLKRPGGSIRLAPCSASMRHFPRLPNTWLASGRSASAKPIGICERAQQLRQPVPVQDAKVSFTVKLSRRLVATLRTYAASTGLTLSEIVSRALQAILHRGGGRG